MFNIILHLTPMTIGCTIEKTAKFKINFSKFRPELIHGEEELELTCFENCFIIKKLEATAGKIVWVLSGFVLTLSRSLKKNKKWKWKKFKIWSHDLNWCSKRHWLPNNLIHFPTSVYFCKTIEKKIKDKNWFIQSSFSEGKQKGRGEMPLSILKLSRCEICVANFIPPANGANLDSFLFKI